VEIARTRPVVEALAKALPAPISIDTRRAEVAEAALDAGARIVNDVSGGAHDPALLEVAARRGAWLILGHLRGEPATMQRAIAFGDVLEEVGDERARSIARAEAAGVARARIVADPGIGFGKRTPHNLALLANAGTLRARLGVPVLVGPSRKSFLGELCGEPEPARRDGATHAACAIALFAGADAVRVHDVAGARAAARVALALRAARR
jgi:dihydropteroate synthase